MTYDIESIVIKVVANNSGDLIIPLLGYSNSGTSNCPYDWKISVDNGTEVTYSGTGGGTLTIGTGLAGGSEHLVIIKPTTVDYQWARAFGTDGDTSIAKYITEIVQDCSYIGYGISATNTGNRFKAFQYQKCSNLTNTAEENLPDGVTTIGEGYMYGLYDGTAISECAVEIMPNSVVSIGNSFRRTQYRSCNNITTTAKEAMSINVSGTLGTYFRAQQYSNCSMLVESADENMNNNVTTIGVYFRYAQYWQCANLAKSGAESMSNSVVTINEGFRQQQYQECSSLTEAPKESISDSLITIGDNFRSQQFVKCTNLNKPAEEIFGDSVTTIGARFRGNQYQDSGIKKTTKEVMSKNINNIGFGFRRYQYWNCLNLTEIVGEKIIDNSVTIGTEYRLCQYYGCTNLSKARLAANPGGTKYRNMCFTNITNPITITILGNVVDNSNVNNTSGLSNTNVNKIYVDSSLVDDYRNSAKRSNVDDDKFVGIPYFSFNNDLLLRGSNNRDEYNVKEGAIKNNMIKRVITGTENWVDNGEGRFYISEPNVFSGDAISTHQFYSREGYLGRRSVYGLGVVFQYSYLSQPITLQEFKDWLAQEYADNTPVIVIYSRSSTTSITTTAYDVDTQDGENLIEITQGGPDVNDLQAQITVEQSTGGYTANVFNGDDYSVESDWIEISDQEEDKGGDVVGPNSSTDGNVVLFDGTTGKIIKDSGVNLSSKQDTLTAGNGIDITNNTVSTTYCYGESTTAAATVQKEVSIPSITELNVGQVIIVKPSTTSSVASSTLKLNSFPAYKMLYNGAEITTSTDSIVWGANIPSMFYLDEVSGTKYWRFLGHGLDSNSTYTLNQLLDAGRYEAGTGTYAITRYSLCMMKADGTWEKITATNASHSTGTSKNVNTNGFVLNQIKYYNTTTNVAGGAFVATNTLASQAASVNLSYSFNCGTAPGWSVGDPIYIVGTMGADGLFYLDTTARWSTTLPSTNDGKLYIRIGTALTATDSTASFLLDRPIFYYDNGIKQYVVGIKDNLTSTSTIDALSANQGKILNDKINDLFGQGKFLSLWDATTGMPISFPLSTPYSYSTGDYFLVETVSSATPPVNYRPTGSSYAGTASTVPETDELEQGDVYIYDGAVWLLQSNHGKTVTFANIAGDPYDNTNLSNALGDKQDTLVSGTTIRTINGTSILGSGDIETPTGIPSQTGEAGKFLTTDGTSVSWGTVSGGVTSVNSQTGAVVLDADDISDSTTTNKFVTASDKTTWNGKQNALNYYSEGTNTADITVRSGVEQGSIGVTPTSLLIQEWDTNGQSDIQMYGTNMNLVNTDGVDRTELTITPTEATVVTPTKTYTFDNDSTTGIARLSDINGIQNDTTGTTTTVTAIRAGTEAEYNALQTHSANIIYHIY